MPFLIDAHEDLAYNALVFGRDYRRAAAETRRLEAGTSIPAATGDALLGWPDYQRGQVALVFGTLFITPLKYKSPNWPGHVFGTYDEAHTYTRAQIEFYRRLTDENPDQFRLVTGRGGLEECLAAWEDSPAEYPRRAHPVGILMLMEGAEGIHSVDEMEEWWQQGLRMAGPVWAGTRFCGGTRESRAFTPEGFALLDVMANLGYILDVSHMTDDAILTSLDRYQGSVMASHANARALLTDLPGERNLSDTAIRRLVEREAVIGVVPFNRFLVPSWKEGEDRQRVRLEHLIAHVDHICQLAGDARHVGLGTDFDGGFGYPAVPCEVDSIADLQKLAAPLVERGYSDADVNGIFSGNWRTFLERSLPEG